MSYQFQMRFAGLCAFVPEKDLGFEDNHVKVLLVDPGAGPKGLLSRELRPHSRILRFPIANLAGVNGSGGTMKDLKGTRELDEVDLTLHLRPQGAQDGNNDVALDGGVQIVSNTGGQAIKPLVYTVEETNFSWIPCMDEILPEAVVNPDYLGDFSQVGPEKILGARIRLDQGTLRTDAVSTHQEDFVVFQFVPTPYDGTLVRQAMAHWAALDVDIDDGFDVVIRAQPFGPNGPTAVEELVLSPIGQETVVVDVSNLCCGHYIDEDAEDGGTAPEAEVDFEAYYLLCREPQALKEKYGQLPIPVPVHYNGKANGSVDTVSGGGTGNDCQMARFSTLYKPISAAISAATEPPIQTAAFPDVFLPPAAQTANQKAPADQSKAPVPQSQGTALLVPQTQPRAGSRLDVPLQKQRKNRLCWAAVAASLDGYYRKGTVDQGTLVGKPESNEPRSMAATLDRLGRLQRTQEGAVAFNVIQHEIAKKRPIVAGIGLSRSHHAVVIVGWDVIDGREHIRVADPKNGSVRLWDYQEFRKNRRFRWHRTYFTQ